MDCREKILSEDYLDYIADYDVMQLYGQTEGADFCYTKIDEDLYVVYGSREDNPSYNIENVRFESIPKCFGLMENGYGFLENKFQNFNYTPLIKSGIIETNNAPLSLTGRNVVVAFIDTGIRYDLDVFRDELGKTRILGLWDQNIQNGMPPEGFLYGTEYTEEMINEALQTETPYEAVKSRDEAGHGTKMASVAVGSILEGNANFRGAAPDASIVAVKLKPAKQNLKDFFLIPPEAVCYSESDILNAIKYVLSFYEVLESPIVICLGIGSTMGDHAGNSRLSAYLERLARRRNIGIVICGGNEGNSAGHFAGEIIRQGNEGYEDVEIKVGENEFGFALTLWGEIPNIYTVEIRSPDGEVIPRISYRVGQINTYDFLYSQSVVSVEYVLVEQTSGQQLIFMKFLRPLSGIWTIRVYASTDAERAYYNMWLPIEGFLRSDTFFLRPNPYTTTTEPAYADSAITVSAYNSANNSFYLRSGRGFSRINNITPDICAPGVEVSTILGNESGSSMAAAITAGAVADFMQWAVTEGNNTAVNSVTIRNYLIRGAQRDSGMEFPNREFGYGRLDLAGVFRALIRN